MKSDELRLHLDQLHTTELGAMRIRRNLALDTDDVVVWCKMKASSSEAASKRNG